MKRYAFIIGSTNGFTNTQIIKKDINLINKYLLSPKGGAWKNSEINIFLDKSSAKINYTINRIKNYNPDYLFLYFSGHGFSIDRKQILVINKKEVIYLNKFFKIAPREMIILDTCRTELTSLESSVVSPNVKPSKPSVSQKQFCRDLFDSCVQRCPPGIQIAYACDSQGKTTINSRKKESAYTAKLIRKASCWTPQYYDKDEYASVFSLMKGVGSPYFNPSYQHSNKVSNPRCFPFAVNTKVSVLSEVW